MSNINFFLKRKKVEKFELQILGGIGFKDECLEDLNFEARSIIRLCLENNVLFNLAKEK